MFGKRFLSFSLVTGAVAAGIVSGKSIFGPPLDDYWKNKLNEEKIAQEKTEGSSS